MIIFVYIGKFSLSRLRLTDAVCFPFTFCDSRPWPSQWSQFRHFFPRSWCTPPASRFLGGDGELTCLLSRTNPPPGHAQHLEGVRWSSKMCNLSDQIAHGINATLTSDWIVFNEFLRLLHFTSRSVCSNHPLTTSKIINITASQGLCKGDGRMTVANLLLWFPFIGTSQRTRMFVVIHAI